MPKTEKQLAIFALIEQYNQDHPGENYNPVIEMIKMGQNPTVDEHVRFSAHKEVAGYMYPKRRPEDQDGNPANDYTIQIVNYSDNRVLETTKTPELPKVTEVQGEIVDSLIIADLNTEDTFIERYNNAY